MIQKKNMSILTAPMTLDKHQVLSAGYGLLKPEKGYHLEAIVRVTEFDRVYDRSFFFPEGTFNPSHVQWEIENEQAKEADEQGGYVTFTLIGHKYHLSVYEIPQLTANQAYKVTFITGYIGNLGQSYDFRQSVEYFIPNNEEPFDIYLGYMYPNTNILKVEAVEVSEMFANPVHIYEAGDF